MEQTKSAGGKRPGAGRKTKYGKHISVKLDPDKYEELRKEAEGRGITMSDLIRAKL